MERVCSILCSLAVWNEIIKVFPQDQITSWHKITELHVAPADGNIKWHCKDDSAWDEEAVDKFPELIELLATVLDWVTGHPTEDDRFRQTLHLTSQKE